MKRYYGLKTKKHNEPLDAFVHQNFIKNKFTDGSFLELGAIDGKMLSNTLFFEENMGFNQGVLIEADPKCLNSLQSNRPNCECFNYVIHSTDKQVEFLINSNKGWAGCVNHEDSKKHIERFHKNKANRDYSSRFSLPAERLDVVLQKTKLKYIDFWSLDVEGSEVECLKCMDWSMPVGLVVVEFVSDPEAIHNLITNQGLRLIEERGGDRFYFNFDYFRKDLFSI